MAAHVFRVSATGSAEQVQLAQWIKVEHPLPIFALSIPEAVGVPAHYVIRRNIKGGGRKDILSLGTPNFPSPYLRIEIYRAGGEIQHFAAPEAVIAVDAASPELSNIRREPPLDSKFGLLSIFSFDGSTSMPRHCLGFVRAYHDPRLQLSGWFCQDGTEFIKRGTLACALHRLTLLSAASDPKVSAFFANAELHLGFCGHRNPLLKPTYKYRIDVGSKAPR